MTFAYLPGPKVVQACRLTDPDLEQKRLDALNLAAALQKRFDAGEISVRPDNDPMYRAEMDHYIYCYHRLRQLNLLAEAVGIGNVAVSAEDFAVIASRYER
jgi:hypothetical protein